MSICTHCGSAPVNKRLETTVYDRYARRCAQCGKDPALAP